MAHARQSKDESGQMVLLNSQGETVRTFRFGGEEESPSAKLFVIYRHDTRRIEPVFQMDDLEASGVEFDILGETSQKELRVRPLAIGKAGSLSWNDFDEETVLPPSYELIEEDDKKDVVMIGKWIGGAQILLIATVLILGHFLAAEKAPEDVTTIRAVQLEPVKEKPPIVQMMEKPVKHVARVQPKVTKKAVVKRQPVPRVVTRHAPKVQTKRQVTARVPKTAPSVENMGALGALGGLSKLKQSGGGLNLSGASLARGGDSGSGGGGVGRGGSGGVSGALFGKGLIAASNGSGARAGSAGGYGTKGKGGGRQGYGTHNMAGASGGYVAPLDNESFVEGGLTRDQVDEVIQRNKGQIRYCYEKGLQGSPGLKGRVSINFVIGASGHVSTARVQQSSVDSSTLEGCVVAKLKNFKFPQPVGGVNVQVRYPFSFSRDLAAN
jgi:TonB family protein